MQQQTSDMDTKKIFMDTGILHAIKHFFLLGLPPGSCTTNLILGNYDRAKLSAHPHLKAIKPQGDIWEDHVDFVRTYIPTYFQNCDGKWRGYAAELEDDPSITTMLLLSTINTCVIDTWIKQAMELK